MVSVPEDTNSTNTEQVVGSVVPSKPKGKAGRPTKAALEATKKRGRPKESTGRIAEFKKRLLATSGTVVIDKIIAIAKDDKHPGQMAALKMCMDRILPVSLFEGNNGQKPSVQINIVNATEPNQSSTVDVQMVEVNREEDE